jgi:hypothetical protein
MTLSLTASNSPNRLLRGISSLMSSSLDVLARHLRLFTAGGMSRPELARRLRLVHRALAAAASAEEPPARLMTLTALSLLDTLLVGGRCDHAGGLGALLAEFEERLRSGRLASVRSFLPRLFAALGPLRLCAVENPLCGAASTLAGGCESQWVDVGLLSPRAGRRRWVRPLGHAREEEVRLIPLSVFARSFFHERLPGLFDGDCAGRVDAALDGFPEGRGRRPTDDFYYHPENDQALLLKEVYPALARRRGFQYFIDGGGLSEIVLDAPTIGRRELVFAARLFCLRNSVRRATLDGRRVVGLPLF